MSYECSEHLHYKVMQLNGEVDLSNSSSIKKCLLDFLKNGHSVIVDFLNLKYIDSSGMAVLVEGLNVANKKNLSIYITSANGSPLQVLELTRLNQVFQIYESISEITD